MTRRAFNFAGFVNMFISGKVYVIRRVQDDMVTISRLRKRRDSFLVSSHMFTKRMGIVEKGIQIQKDDLVYKGFGKGYRLLRKIIK